MTYTLDTNVIAAPMRGEQQVTSKLERRLLDGHEVTLNAVSYFETRRGLQPEAVQKRLLLEVLVQVGVLALHRPALDAAATIYADLLVLGIALTYDATLVTRNLRHFERIEGLRLESWEA